MRENRIDWTRFFKPVCLLCMVCGGLWLWWQSALTENTLGRITAIAGGALVAIQGLLADAYGLQNSFWLTIVCEVYVLWYALYGSAPKNAPTAAEILKR